ncbi:MAG: porin [Bacteroidetes bacterium]|nr:porin [Bacteroidota bacterium]MBM3424763.1 porin [Bacteroidota bacterium]
MQRKYVFAALLVSLNVSAQLTKDTTKWYDKIQLRGYAQVRYNGLLQTNEDLECEQCDKSWGGDNDFFIRRMRLIFYGQLSSRVYFYVQPDFASSSLSTSLHFGQLRDAYFDVGVDKESQFRFRIGQSKVPYGFENMQSSQNRLPLDRADALNSAVSNERDLGVFFYWAPTSKRKLFSTLVSSGLKGSGDYGVFGVGIYNGQVANRPESNANKHIVTRVSYPFEIKKQIIEAGIQAYTGKVTLVSTSPGVNYATDKLYDDKRVAGTVVLYPKPFGVLAEYTIGRGPQFDKTLDSITTQRLHGGFVTASYMLNLKNNVLIPFVRYQVYQGGKKHELDARSYNVEELEIGVEWQMSRYFELVMMYTMSSRRFEDYENQDNYQRGNLLRLQAQVNF